MGSPEAFLTSGMSSSSLDGGLTKSLLDSASLSTSLDDSSSLLGLQKALTTTGASLPISSGLDRLSTKDTTTSGNNSSDSNQGSTANDSSLVGSVFDNSLFSTNQGKLATVSSQPLSSNSTTNNSTTGVDPLTGSTNNAELVSITSNDPLTNASKGSSPITKNEETDPSVSPTIKTAFKVGSSVENADANSLNDSPVLEGKFGNFDGHKNFQLNIKDASGNSETFSLKGDGEGEVFKISQGEQVIFTGTDASTLVQISAFNNIQFGNYIGSGLNVQTKGSIKAGNITLKNTASSNNPGLSLQSGLGDVQNVAGSYSVTDLGTFSPTGINNSGQVVGNDYYNDHALLYSDGKITDLGTLTDGSISYATGINDSGQVVGYAFSGNTPEHAFLYTNNQITDLGTLPNGTISYATSINKSGQVVGGANILEYHAPYDTTDFGYGYVDGYGYQNESYTVHHNGYYSSEVHAFIDSNGQMTDLGTLPGYSVTEATGINNSGQVVGSSNGTNGTHAFIDSNGQMTDLGTLPGYSNSYATGINDSGQVVGSSNGTNGTHAFIDSNGQMTDLGILPGYSDSEATGINNSGQVVGYSNGTNGTHAFIDSKAHAFIDSNGQMTDLNSLISKESGWTLSDAKAINNFGQIVGDGEIRGQGHAFLLNPISTSTPKDGITVGNISTLGGNILLQGLKINLTGAKVVSHGGNITFDGPTILNSSTGADAFNSTQGAANSKGGNITFKNTVDSNSAGTSSLNLTAGFGNITFNKAVGSSAALKDLTVNSAKTVTALGDITTNGNTAIFATQDITTGNLSSNSGVVSLISTQGAVTNGDITAKSGGVAVLATQNITTNNIHSQNGTVTLSSHTGTVTTNGDITTSGGGVDIAAGGNVVTHTILSKGGAVSLISSLGSVTTSGEITNSGDVDITAAKDIATKNILSTGRGISLSSITGSITANGDITNSGGFVDIEANGNVAISNILSNNGAVSLISNQGSITATGDITTKGGYVNIEATDDVATRNIRTLGGGIDLTSVKGAVTTGFLNSDGNGTGGDIDVQAAGLFRATDSLPINGTNYSIYTGNAGVTIQVGGGSVNSAIAFAVGDATTNGTAAAISTGTDTISPLKSFSGSTHLGSIDIIAQGSVPLLSESPSKSDSDKELGKSQGTQPDLLSIPIADNSTVKLELHQNEWPSQINLSLDKQQQLEGFIKQLWNVGQPLAEFVLGTMYQFLYDNGAPIRSLLQPLQLTPKEEALLERTLPQSTAFKLGRTLGGGAGIVQGIVEFLAGTGSEAGGGGLCFTGIGCFAGAPAIAAGAILQSHGAATAIFSAGEEGKLLRDLLSPNKMESSSNNPLEEGQNLYVPNSKDNTTLSSIREELSSENIQSDKKIDEGGFGTVYEIPEHKDLVIKVPTKSKGGQNNQLVQEAKNLSYLTNKNYPTVYKGLIEWVDSNGITRQGIVMEKVDGVLSKRILRQGKFTNKSPDPVIEKYVTQKTIEDLKVFKQKAKDDTIVIDDLQFMVSKKDGSIRLIDPARVEYLPSKLQKNGQIIIRGETANAKKANYILRIDKLIQDFSNLLKNQ